MTISCARSKSASPACRTHRRRHAGCIEPARYIGGSIREARDLMDAQVLLGFEGKAYHARDFYCSQILANMLGGGMSSRLFQEVREFRGLCYSVYAFHWGFSDTGIFGIHAATGGENLPELMPVIIDELRKSSEDIHQYEIDRARAQIRAQLLMGQESPAARAGQIARQMMLYGRPISNTELMERLTGITTERLTDLAGRLFFDTVPRPCSAIGPVDQLASMDEISQLARRAARRRDTRRQPSELRRFRASRDGKIGLRFPVRSPARRRRHQGEDHLLPPAAQCRLQAWYRLRSESRSFLETVGAELGAGRADGDRAFAPASSVRPGIRLRASRCRSSCSPATTTNWSAASPSAISAGARRNPA